MEKVLAIRDTTDIEIPVIYERILASSQLQLLMQMLVFYKTKKAQPGGSGARL